MVEIICKVLGIARRTYFHWQKSPDKCYSINLFNKYFSEKELLEFMETGKIAKFENLNFYLMSSSMSFLIKLEQLNIKDFFGFDYFSKYIVYYICNGFEVDKDGNEYWVGENEIKNFQNDFMKFLLATFNDSGNKDFYLDLEIGSLDDFRYLTSFINNFTESDLIYLNMNIDDNFSLLLDFEKSNKEFYSKQKHTFVQFENSLINSLKEELSEDGNLKELMFLYKKSIINNI